ncbi:MAG: hypothetical protein NVS1B14_01630 [Vulcanimicrobiaceae bacterium]
MLVMTNIRNWLMLAGGLFGLLILVAVCAEVKEQVADAHKARAKAAAALAAEKKAVQDRADWKLRFADQQRAEQAIWRGMMEDLRAQQRKR